jgi:hypothetical protein
MMFGLLEPMKDLASSLIINHDNSKTTVHLSTHLSLKPTAWTPLKVQVHPPPKFISVESIEF